MAKKRKAKGGKSRHRPFDNVDAKILTLMMSNPAMTNQELADACDYKHRESIRARTNRPEFQARFEIEANAALKRARRKANVGAEKGIDRLSAQLDRKQDDADDARVVQGAAKILNSLALGEKQVHEGGDKPVSLELTSEQKAELAKKILSERGK